MQYEDLRREAYIEAINLKEKNKLVSTFGRVPWELIYSFSLFSVPSYGIDLYVMENFKKDENLCDLLNSTKIYLREDKCPLMFSSSFFVVDDFCQKRNDLLYKSTDKKIYVYKTFEDFTSFLEDISGKKLDMEKLKEVTAKSIILNNLILDIRKLDMDIKEIFEIEYFSKFILNLDERIHFLEIILKKYKNLKKLKKDYIKVCAGCGIYHNLSSRDEVLLECGCEGENFFNIENDDLLSYLKEKYSKKRVVKFDYSIRGCPFDEGKKLNYLGGI